MTTVDAQLQTRRKVEFIDDGNGTTPKKPNTACFYPWTNTLLYELAIESCGETVSSRCMKEVVRERGRE